MKAMLTFAILVGGCVVPVADPRSDDTCDRAAYLNLLGTNIAAVTLPASPDIRAFGETDAVTQDFVPTRTNIVYDGVGTIMRIYCG